METILFGLVMLAVGWLVLWFCADHSKPSKVWWPFDYRTTDPVTPAVDEPRRRGALRRSRRNPTRPWKRSGF
jgi:hypothetical protein